MEKIIFVLHIVATFLLTGMIWIIQIVQYPFFSYVGTEDWKKYHDNYRFWITPIVAPAMIIEFLTAGLLLFYPFVKIDEKFIWTGLILVLIIWASTFFIQVPLHERLAVKFNENIHKLLVQTNWIRTLAWSLRSLLMIYFVWKMFDS
jgi:hypothetical protein